MQPTAPRNDLTRELAATLQQRRSELRLLLQDSAEHMPGSAGEVTDFKDLAEGDAHAAVDDATLSLAAMELGHVVAALRRIDEGTYGTCEDCGAPIDVRRLRALPASALCTACQAAREGAGKPR